MFQASNRSHDRRRRDPTFQSAVGMISGLEQTSHYVGLVKPGFADRVILDRPHLHGKNLTYAHANEAGNEHETGVGQMQSAFVDGSRFDEQSPVRTGDAGVLHSLSDEFLCHIAT